MAPILRFNLTTVINFLVSNYTEQLWRSGVSLAAKYQASQVSNQSQCVQWNELFMSVLSRCLSMLLVT